MPKRNVATNFTFEQQRQEINLIAADLWDGVLGGSSTDFSTVVGWGDHNQAGYLKADGTVATTAAFTFGNKIIGPSTFTIEPTNVNGTVVIAGNLQVDGTQTAVNSTTMDVTDLNITVAKGAANSAAADTAGITVDGANATLQYEDGSPGTWESSLGFRLDGRNASAGLKLNLAGSADYLIRESTTDDIVQFGGTGAANFFAHNLSSGNIGIAEANPSHKLDVNGTLRVTGNSTFGANGSITSAANFTLNGNALTVTGTATAVGEFKGATIPTIQVTQTTDNTDLQLRANATGGLVRTAGAFPLIFGTFQEERLRIHESNAFVTVNHGNAETNSALILSKADAGYAKLEFDVGTSQKAYVELDASENLIHYGAAGVNQQFYAGGSSRLTITDGGNVGIGTGTDPVDRKLHVKSSGLIAKLESTTANSLIMFATPTNETAGTVPNIGANDNDLEFTTGNLSRLKIHSDGKVAIGDHTATKRLDIRGTGNQGILVGSTDNNGAQIILDGNGGGDASGGNYGALEVLNNGDFTIRNHDASQSIIFGVGSASGANNTLVLDSSQNATFAGNIATTNDGSSSLALKLQSGSTWGIRSNPTSGTNPYGLDIYKGSGGTDVKFKIDQNGAATFAGTVTDSKGNLRSVPYNSPNSAHVATAADAGKCIYIAYDVHFNPSVFSPGDVVTIIPTTGITIKENAGMTIYNTADGSTGDRSLAARGMATMWFHDHNLAYISGVQLT